MQQTQAQLENETLEVSVGGGAVRVVITGHQRVRSILINPEVVDLNDEEWMQDLQDLVTLAVNQAIEESQALAAERLEKITGGLGGLPGLGGMFG
jgi:DNA-binding protein YbaB